MTRHSIHLIAIALYKQVATLTLGVTDVDICVFPPHPFLVPVFDKIEATNVKLGAQNCHFEDSGTYVRAICACVCSMVYYSIVCSEVNGLFVRCQYDKTR